METIENVSDAAEDRSLTKEGTDYREIDDSDIEYPDSDGEPMGETGYHVRASMHLLSALRLFFNGRDDVYVAADMFLYYEKGNPAACKAPDVMVIKGVGNQERRTFKTWKENAAPCLIFEITSQSSMIDDLVLKTALYARLGVKEYFVFDPLHEYMKEPFTGFRLANGTYSPISTDEDGGMFCEELGATLKRDNDLLRIVDPQTGKFVPSIEEASRMAREEAGRAKRESERAEQEFQRAEQEFQRAEKESQRAEKESQRAEKESQRAEQESQRANFLATKLREMGVDPDSLSLSSGADR